ncbi:MAG: hypothetical protein ACQEP7_05385 [bacterium]
MSIVNLAEFEDVDGDYVSVWFDPAEEAVVVQYNFVHFTLEVDQFNGFVDALNRGQEALNEEL